MEQWCQSEDREGGTIIRALWLEHWTSKRKVARSNPLADKVKICRPAPEQGS